jgi:hypothetical protein
LLIISGEYLVLDSHTQILFVAVEKKKKVFEFIFFRKGIIRSFFYKFL